MSANEALHADRRGMLIWVSCVPLLSPLEQYKMPPFPRSNALLVQCRGDLQLSLSLVVMTSLVLASLLVPIALAGSPKTCSNPQLSCQNTTLVSDLCCFNAPGGQLLQTQFWDTSMSWTLMMAVAVPSQMIDVSQILLQALLIVGLFMAYGPIIVMERTTPTVTPLGRTPTSLRSSTRTARPTFYPT